MFAFFKEKARGWRMPSAFAAWFVLVSLQLGAPAAHAQTVTEGWYRLRTNSVPYGPQSVALDAAGGVWVSAPEGVPDEYQYAPGVWYRPAGASATPSFQYITGNGRNNLVGAGYNPPVVKPQLNAPVLYAVRDKGGNSWYALNNRKVLCEKADHSWLTFDMPDSSGIQPGVNTASVDSAHRIRLLDKPDGSQEKLLIAGRGIVRINAGFTVAETRAVYSPYNNDFIKDALMDSQGRYWVTSERGVEKGTSLVTTQYVADLYPSDPNAPTGSTVTRIVEDSLGNVWFGTYGDGVYRYAATGAWTRFAAAPVSSIGNSVIDIAAGSNGTVWFGALFSGNGGILRYVPAGGGQWTRFTEADLGLQSGQVPGLAWDGAGLWFTTGYHPGVTGNGTGVHRLTFTAQGQPVVAHYTYRGDSTTLADLRYSYIAADKSGGVWFPSYDDPSIARLKGDGSWQQFRQTGSGSFGSFGFAGVAVDSKNRVYFAPQNSPPVAYDVMTEQWLTLPAQSFGDYFYYGVYVDPQDGKWFHGAFGVYYLNPGNTAWTRYRQEEIPQFPDNYVDGVLADDGGNVWFMCRYGIALMKRNPAGGAPTWFTFTYGTAGYTGGYRVYQDDGGQVWNAAKQKFDSLSNSWLTVADTSAFDQRHLRFANGRVSADLALTGAPFPVSGQAGPEERTMTLDSRGTVYFSGGISDIQAGIVALGPPAGGTLAVTANAGGAGSGAIGSSPSGIAYRYDTAISGTAGFGQGSTLVLTATADAGSTAGWGDCAANGGVAGGTTAAATCTFTGLAAAKTVTATFSPLRYLLSLTLSGDGGGSVNSTPSGPIACTYPPQAGTCSGSRDAGSSLTLVATPGSDSTFGGWGGSCGSCPGLSCALTMNGDKSCSAAFNVLRFVKVSGPAYYASIAKAYEGLDNSPATMQARDLEFIETLSFDRNIQLTLLGGYADGFGSATGFTTLHGTLTVSQGSLVASRIVVR